MSEQMILIKKDLLLSQVNWFNLCEFELVILPAKQRPLWPLLAIQRPISRLNDHCWPIRDQYSGHVITMSQSEASEVQWDFCELHYRENSSQQIQLVLLPTTCSPGACEISFCFCFADTSFAETVKELDSQWDPVEDCRLILQENRS